MRTEIIANSLVKETEKAICVNVSVTWGMGGCKQKNIWFPKSVAEIITINGDLHILVQDWFADKISKDNAYKGYLMNFEFSSIIN